MIATAFRLANAVVVNVVDFTIFAGLQPTFLSLIYLRLGPCVYGESGEAWVRTTGTTVHADALEGS
jgi:hypothetical protein